MFMLLNMLTLMHLPGIKITIVGIYIILFSEVTNVH